MSRAESLKQRRRLHKGCCPTHGIPLVQVGVAHDQNGRPYADEVACPVESCSFKTVSAPGSTLWKALRGNQPERKSEARGPFFRKPKRAEFVSMNDYCEGRAILALAELAMEYGATFEKVQETLRSHWMGGWIIEGWLKPGKK
jgi:hypothetical protein